MDLTQLTVIVSLIMSLSIASERLVEIIKGFFPLLDKSRDDPVAEGRRRSYIQLLAVISGIVTAYLARDYLPVEVAKVPEGWAVVGLGLLVSGGSGVWNSVLSYLSHVKEAQKIDLEVAKKNV
jgi:hypothetical protein